MASDEVLNNDWYVIPIKGSNVSQPVILELDNSQTDIINIYELTGGKISQTLNAGDLVPYQDRQHEHRNIIYEFHPLDQGSVILINVQNRGTYGIPVNVYEKSYFHGLDDRRTMIIGMYLGLVIIFILFVSASLVLAEYDHTHFYYLLYLVFTGLYFFVELGFGDIYFWPSTPQLEEPFILAFALASTLSFLMLVFHLFKVKGSTNAHRLFFKVLFILISIALLILLSGMIRHDSVFVTLYYMVLITVGATFIFALVIGYDAVRRKVAYAKYFLLAFSAMILGTVIKPLSLLGIIPYNSYVHYGGVIGHSFEIICLSTLLLLEFFRRMRYSHSLETQLVKLEKSALQAQMNPHFIFNCLNSIQNYIATNEKRRAMDYLTQFARLIRSTLDASASRTITLQQELDMLENYLQLEQMRFKDKFDYRIRCDEDLDLDDVEVPPLLIQPFAENAIIHGFKGMDRKGKLSIDFKEVDEELLVIIEDNGIGFKKKETSSNHKSMAMSITNQRLKFLNPEKDHDNEIVIESGEDNIGTKVTLRVYVGD